MRKRSKVRVNLLIILVVALLMGVFNFPLILNKPIEGVNAKWQQSIPTIPEVPFRLGLDLQGGAHLVYEADMSGVDSDQRGEAIEGARDVLARRVDPNGLYEALVQINSSNDNYRIIVELAGVHEDQIAELIKNIGEAPLLEFKELNNEPERELNAEERKELNDFNRDARATAQKALQKALSGADFSEVATEFTQNDLERENGGSIGFIGRNFVVSEVYEAAKATKANRVYSKLIEQDKGYNIIKVNEIKEEGTEVKANHLLICYKGADGCTQELSKEDAYKKIEELKETATTENFVDLAKENSTEPGANETGGSLGWFASGTMVKEFDEVVFAMGIHEVSDIVETNFGYHLIYKVDERPIELFDVSRIFINKKVETDILPAVDPWSNTELTGAQLKNAQVLFDQNTSIPQVAITFDSEGKELFGQITERNIGKPVAIFLDGYPISTPTVNEAIRDGEAVITGSFTLDEAQTLSRGLDQGALPVPLKLMSQQTVGASLGAESLQKSLWAGLIGLILVALFMIGYYRLPGLLAVIALIIYGVVISFIFKTIPVTLTLSGIAGFILSIGMAVDANVLIFERLKEELRSGKPLGSAIDEGFNRAWTAIRDGNVSTLITCFILAWFGTSMIQGFAITLGLGVLLSMFSAIIVTRMLLKLFINPDKQKKRMWLFGVKK